MLTNEDNSNLSGYYDKNPDITDSVAIPLSKKVYMARLIDKSCRGGDQTISVNCLAADSLLAIMDYWYENTSL